MDKKQQAIRTWLASRYDKDREDKEEKDISQVVDGLEIRNEIWFRAGPKTLKKLALGILGTTGFAGLYGLGVYLGGAYYADDRIFDRYGVECSRDAENQPVVGKPAENTDTDPSECKVDD